VKFGITVVGTQCNLVYSCSSEGLLFFTAFLHCRVYKLHSCITYEIDINSMFVYWSFCCNVQHMESEQDAQKAIRSLNGHILNGNRLNVEVTLYKFFFPSTSMTSSDE